MRVHGFRGINSARNNLGRRRGGGGANPLHTIGALTLVGAGGREVSAPDGTYGPYTVASGVLTPNTSPVTPGTYNVGGITITAEANTYDVATGQLAAVVALGSAALDGKTVKVLPNADACGAADGSTILFGSGITLVTGLVVTSRDPMTKGFMRRIRMHQTGTITFTDLIIRDFWTSGDSPFTPVIEWGAYPAIGRFWRCELFSDALVSNDMNPPVVSTIVSGRYYRIASVSNANWTSVGGPASAAIGNSFMATSSGSIASLGTAQVYPKSLRMFSANPPAPTGRGMEILDCYIHDAEYGIACSMKSVRVERTWVEDTYADHTQFTVYGDETFFLVKDNWFGKGIDHPDSPFGFHIDCCQLNLINMFQANTEAYQFIGNRIFLKGTTGLTQGLFLADPNGFAVKATLKHNILLLGLAQGLTVEGIADASVIRWNTIAYDQDSLAGALVPKIVIINENGTTGATVRDNAHSGFAIGGSPLTTAKMRNNYQFASFNDAGMTAVLMGTTFGCDDFADLAAFTAAMQPRPGSALDVAYGPKIGAGWYYTYGAAPAGSMSGLGEGTANEPAPSIPLAFTVGQWEVTAKNAAIEVAISALPNDGGDYFSAIQYRVNGGSWTASGLSAVGTFDITGLTNGVNYSVELRAVNSAGSGAGSDVKSATPTNAYAANGVEFDSGDSMSSTSFSAAASKKFAIDFWFKMPGSMPTSGALFALQEPGGASRIYASFASTGRMMFFSNIANAYTTPNNTFVADTWYHIQWSVDTTAGARRALLYINGVSFPIVSAAADDAVFPAIGRLNVGNFAATKQMADLYINLAESINFADAGERAKFDANVSKGTDGSIPTGSIPVGFFSGATGFWHINKGSGGGLTLVGALTTASSAPP